MANNTLVVAVVVAVLTFLTGVINRVFTERANRRRDVEIDRREAYGRYLVAQQALRDTFELDRARSDDARGDGQADRYVPSAGWFAEDVRRDSGAAEMNARLVAGEGVSDALSMFEDFANSDSRT